MFVCFSFSFQGGSDVINVSEEHDLKTILMSLLLSNLHYLAHRNGVPTVTRVQGFGAAMCLFLAN